jgi:hypothetical protein
VQARHAASEELDTNPTMRSMLRMTDLWL